MVCKVVKAMTLCKESIKLRMSPSSATHARACMVVMDGEPSGTQHPTPDREEGPQLSPGDHHLGGWTPHQIQVNLRDLRDAELCQFMEDLYQEVALRELNTHPWDPLPTPWGHLVGNRNPSEDDQEVTFLWEGGWEPRGQPPQPPAPAQPNEDVDVLLTHWPWDCDLVSSYKHCQWQNHAWQDRSVFWTKVPWGTVCKRPLPRVSGQR